MTIDKIKPSGGNQETGELGVPSMKKKGVSSAKDLEGGKWPKDGQDVGGQGLKEKVKIEGKEGEASRAERVLAAEYQTKTL